MSAQGPEAAIPGHMRPEQDCSSEMRAWGSEETFPGQTCKDKTAGSCRISTAPQANHPQFVRMQMSIRVCCIWPRLMSDVHTSCCDREVPLREVSEAFECQQRLGLRFVQRYRGKSSMTNYRGHHAYNF